MENVQSDNIKRHPGGRPKKVVKKDIFIGVRFSKLEYYVVKQKATRSGLTYSAYIREMILKGKVNSRLTEEERLLIRQLVGMANNVNQIANIANKEGASIAISYFIKIRKNLDEVLEKLKK